MDGRKKRSAPKNLLLSFTLPVLIAFIPQAALAQAMGKAALDAPAPAATLPALAALPAIQVPPAVTAQVTPSATPTTPPLVSELKSQVPAPDSNPVPPTVQAPAVFPAVPNPIPAAVPAPQLPKIVDSLPSEPAKPAAAAPELLPIEHQSIRPSASDNPTSPGEAKPPADAHNKSYFSLPGLQSVFQVAAALAIVLGLVFIAKAAAKKFLPAAKTGTGKGVIEILARYPLSKNQSLVLVRIGSQIVTLNQGKDQSQSVLVISDAQEVAKILGQIEGTSPKSIQAGFNKLLANARMDLESPVNNPENDFENRSMEPENLDNQLEEMAAAKRQLMQLRQQVRSVRDSLPASRR